MIKLILINRITIVLHNYFSGEITEPGKLHRNTSKEKPASKSYNFEKRGKVVVMGKRTPDP